MKYICMSLLAVLCLAAYPFSTAWGEEKPKVDARETVDGYVLSALAGKVDEAAALAVAGQSPARKERIAEFRGIIGAKVLSTAGVFASEKKGEAIAVSEAVKLTKGNPGRNTGAVVFELVKLGDKWLVKDLDFRSVEVAQEKVKEFEEKNPDAREIPAKPTK